MPVVGHAVYRTEVTRLKGVYRRLPALSIVKAYAVIDRSEVEVFVFLLVLLPEGELSLSLFIIRSIRGG